MTVSARLIGMCANRRDMAALRLLMAAHAARRADRQIRSEPVAVLTRRRLREADRILDVQRRRYLAMAAPTQIGGRRCEAGLAVAIATGNVSILDVDAMTGAVAHDAPHCGNMIGDTPGRALGTARHERQRGEHDHHDAPDHRVAPSG